ncbi:unnamed protein product, partial [Didymodactylos carnosus]
YQEYIHSCQHSVVNEIWQSLLDQLSSVDGKTNAIRLILIQFLSCLFNSYRIFDLHIPKQHLEQCEMKYNQTLILLQDEILQQKEKYPKFGPIVTQTILKCYLSMGWFALALSSFSNYLHFTWSMSTTDDETVKDKDTATLNHNGYLFTKQKWLEFHRQVIDNENEDDLRNILFQLCCQRLYRLLSFDEQSDVHIVLTQLKDFLEHPNISSSVLQQVEPFLFRLSHKTQMKLIRTFIDQIIDNKSFQLLFLLNEQRLQMLIIAICEKFIQQQQDTVRENDLQTSNKKRKSTYTDSMEYYFEINDNGTALYDYLVTKISDQTISLTDANIVTVCTNIF